MKHSTTVYEFICSICSSVCKQAHTLKEHFRDVHKEDVSIEFAKTAARPKTDKTDGCGYKDKKTKKSKKKLSKLFCECGEICTGKSNLRRHIKNMHIKSNDKKKTENSKSHLTETECEQVVHDMTESSKSQQKKRQKRGKIDEECNAPPNAASKRQRIESDQGRNSFEIVENSDHVLRPNEIVSSKTTCQLNPHVVNRVDLDKIDSEEKTAEEIQFCRVKQKSLANCGQPLYVLPGTEVKECTIEVNRSAVEQFQANLYHKSLPSVPAAENLKGVDVDETNRNEPNISEQFEACKNSQQKELLVKNKVDGETRDSTADSEFSGEWNKKKYTEQSPSKIDKNTDGVMTKIYNINKIIPSKSNECILDPGVTQNLPSIKSLPRIPKLTKDRLLKDGISRATTIEKKLAIPFG